MTIEESWKRIKEWHRANAPPGTLRLQRGATKRALERLESLIGVALPAEFQESYALHNGTGETSLLYYGSLLSTTRIPKEWSRFSNWQKSDGYGSAWDPPEVKSPFIKRIWWNRLRIPLVEKNGDHVMLDLDPAKGRNRGQIIDFSHEVGPTDLLASSFAKWLAQIAGDLAANKYIYSEDARQVQPVEW